MSGETKVRGMAQDGTEFTAESPEVIAELEKFPDLTLEAAIGNVVMARNQADGHGDEVPEGAPHIVTQEDLDANPDLVTEGVKVGETIYLQEVCEDCDGEGCGECK